MIQSWFRLVWKLLEAYIHIYIYTQLYLHDQGNQRSSDSILSPFLLCAVFGVTATSIRHPKNGSFLNSIRSFRGFSSEGNGLGSDRFQHREDLSVSWDARDEFLGW